MEIYCTCTYRYCWPQKPMFSIYAKLNKKGLPTTATTTTTATVTITASVTATITITATATVTAHRHCHRHSTAVTYLFTVPRAQPNLLSSATMTSLRVVDLMWI